MHLYICIYEIALKNIFYLSIFEFFFFLQYINILEKLLW